MNPDCQTQSASTATMTVYQATILKQFAELEKTPNVLALDLPGSRIAIPILRENLPLVPAAVD